MTDARPTAETFGSGRVWGPYRIERLLGAGGFADVYLARHTILDQEVALKIIRHSTADQAEIDGARIMCRLSNPHIVRVVAADRIEDRLTIAMDYVPGRSLREALDRDGPMTAKDARRLGLALGRALDYLHQFAEGGLAGLAHLDVKPSNVIMADDGRIVLTDFGIARISMDGTGARRPVAGSPVYMAPEQFDGEGAASADVWAVGALLFEVLTGHPPPWAASGTGTPPVPDAVAEALRQAALPPDWASLLQACLCAEPAGRPTAADVCRRLEAMGAEREAPHGRRCPRCGAAFRPDQDCCLECTVRAGAEAQPAGLAALWDGQGKPESNQRPGRPSSSPRTRRTVAVAVVLIAVVGVAAAVAVASMAWGVPRDPAKFDSPSLTFQERIAGLSRLRDRQPFWMRRATTEHIAALERGRERWGALSGRVAKASGEYADVIDGLNAFNAAYAGTPEAAEAARLAAVWEREAEAFGRAQAVDADRSRSDSEHLEAWRSFALMQRTGLKRQAAEERISALQDALARFTGDVELTVVEARGLAPADRDVTGHGQADPFFVVLVDGRAVYQSLAFKDTSVARWDERVRLPVTPATTLAVEIRDRDPLGHDVVAVVPLTPLPADGRSTVRAGQTDLDIVVKRVRQAWR